VSSKRAYPILRSVADPALDNGKCFQANYSSRVRRGLHPRMVMMTLILLCYAVEGDDVIMCSRQVKLQIAYDIVVAVRGKLECDVTGGADIQMSRGLQQNCE
jgi:hypothetical protein